MCSAPPARTARSPPARPAPPLRRLRPRVSTRRARSLRRNRSATRRRAPRTAGHRARRHRSRPRRAAPSRSAPTTRPAGSVTVAKAKSVNGTAVFIAPRTTSGRALDASAAQAASPGQQAGEHDRRHGHAHQDERHRAELGHGDAREQERGTPQRAEQDEIDDVAGGHVGSDKCRSSGSVRSRAGSDNRRQDPAIERDRPG